MRNLISLMPPSVLLCISATAIAFGTYYAVAQSTNLPGSERLRDRWASTATRRGTSGHRSHRPRANGPIDLTLLGGIALVTAYQGMSLKRRQRQGIIS